MPKYKQVPFDVDCYVDEVQDVMQELNMTGVTDTVMIDAQVSNEWMNGCRAPHCVSTIALSDMCDCMCLCPP